MANVPLFRWRRRGSGTARAKRRTPWDRRGRERHLLGSKLIGLPHHGLGEADSIMTFVPPEIVICTPIIDDIDFGDGDCWVTRENNLGVLSMGEAAIHWGATGNSDQPSPGNVWSGPDHYNSNFAFVIGNQYAAPGSDTALFKDPPCQPQVCSGQGLRFTCDYSIFSDVLADLSNISECHPGMGFGMGLRVTTLGLLEFRVGRITPGGIVTTSASESIEFRACDVGGINGGEGGISCMDLPPLPDSPSGSISLDIPAADLVGNRGFFWVRLRLFPGDGFYGGAIGTSASCSTPFDLFTGFGRASYSVSVDVENAQWAVI